MTTENIISTIYDYYPKDIDWDNIEAVADSLEYKNRINKCHEAAANNMSWVNLKEELTTYNLSLNGSRVYDYSILGSVPCYHGSMIFGALKSNIISLFISVIIPLWSYRIMDRDGIFPIRFKYVNKEEEIIVQNLTALVAKHFPKYNIISEDQHQIVIPDITTAFKQAPKIFEAIFTENEN